jgi:hypothetical protein
MTAFRLLLSDRFPSKFSSILSADLKIDMICASANSLFEEGMAVSTEILMSQRKKSSHKGGTDVD